MCVCVYVFVLLLEDMGNLRPGMLTKSKPCLKIPDIARMIKVQDICSFYMSPVPVVCCQICALELGVKFCTEMVVDGSLGQLGHIILF